LIMGLLSSERDELQKDVETMCLQQAGVASSADVGTRMQARRYGRKEPAVREDIWGRVLLRESRLSNGLVQGCQFGARTGLVQREDDAPHT
jgi:hypothetical protein